MGSIHGSSTKLRILSRQHVGLALDMPHAIEAMRVAFGALSAGTAAVPLRLSLATERGITFFMPAHLKDTGALGAKIASVYADNPAHALAAVSALVLVLDSTTGMPMALMEGGYLTALRTGAASGLATDLLARRDASVLAIFGAGAQARTQVEAVRAVRPIREIRVVDRSAEAARRFAAEVEGCDVICTQDARAAVRGAHVIVTVTTSTAPVFDGDDVEEGAHVNGLGSYAPHMREVDSRLVARARIVVDSRPAALAEAGDLVIPIREGVITPESVCTELGDIVNGVAMGRSADHEITFFKSVGNAVQDVTAARHVLEVAERRGLGIVVEL